MKRFFLSVALIGILAINIQPAFAEITLRGFGSITAGIGLTDDFDQEYAQNVAHGYDDKLSFSPDSLFAIQLDSELDENLSVTIQVVSRAEYPQRSCAQQEAVFGSCSKDKYAYTPRFEWAYISYAFDSNNKLNIGRMRLPFYRYTDYLDVRYAYNWLKAPSPVYDLEFPSFEGFSYLHDFALGDWEGTTQVIYGSLKTNDIDFGIGAETESNDLIAANIIIGWNWLTLRTGYVQGDTSIAAPAYTTAANGSAFIVNAVLDGVWAQTAPQRQAFELATGTTLSRPDLDLIELQNHILMEEDTSTFLDFAIGIDSSSFVFDAEWINYAIEDSMFPDVEAYFVTFGWRFGDFLPTLTYANRDGKISRDILDEIPSLGAPFEEGPLAPINEAFVSTAREQVYNNVLSLGENTFDEDVWTLALRYDFRPSATLKFSYDVRQLETLDKDAKLLRFGIDFLF